MAERQVRIVIRGKDAGASTQMRKVGVASSALRTKLVALASTAAATFGAFAAVRFANSAVEAFGRQEQAEKKVAAGLRILGKESDAAIKRAKVFAAGIQKITTIGDEATLELMGLGAALGRLSGKQLEDATVAAIGLSEAFNIELLASMRLVSRAAIGDTSSLTRYGIKLDETLSPQQKFAEVLRRGAEGFEIAKAAAETTTGQLGKVANAISDLTERIGKLVAPLKLKLKTAFLDNALVIEQFVIKNKELIKTLVASVTAVAAAATAMVALKLAIFGVSKALVLLSTNPLVITLTILGALVALFIETAGEGETFAAKIQSIGVKVAGALKPLMPIWTQLKNVAVAAWTAIKEVSLVVWNSVLKPVFTSIGGEIGGLIKLILPDFQVKFDGVMKAIIVILAAVETAFTQWKTVLKLAFKVALLGVVSWWENIKQVFGTTLPTVLKFAAKIFGEFWVNVANFAQTVFDNLRSNVIEFFKALPAQILHITTAGLFGKAMGDIWKPLGEGFKAEFSTFPGIAKRALGDLEGQLMGEINAIGAGLGAAFIDKATQRLAEAGKVERTGKGAGVRGIVRSILALVDTSKFKQVATGGGEVQRKAFERIKSGGKAAATVNGFESRFLERLPGQGLSDPAKKTEKNTRDANKIAKRGVGLFERIESHLADIRGSQLTVKRSRL